MAISRSQDRFTWLYLADFLEICLMESYSGCNPAQVVAKYVRDTRDRLLVYRSSQPFDHNNNASDAAVW